jgi:predicted TPR repeat methyltransferase
MTLDEKVVRGNRAQRLLDDDMLAEAFAKLEQEYVTQWRNTEFRDQDARERLWWAARVVAKVREHLLIVAKNGEIAQRELRTLTERKRTILG